MAITKVLIAVKTYPTFSTKYEETVLAVFKPTKILNFKFVAVDREWKQAKTDIEHKHNNLFKIVKKLLFKFFCTFVDNMGTKFTLMLEDWEIGQLYWKWQAHLRFMCTYKCFVIINVIANVLTTLLKQKIYIFISAPPKNDTLGKLDIHLL